MFSRFLEFSEGININPIRKIEQKINKNLNFLFLQLTKNLLNLKPAYCATNCHILNTCDNEMEHANIIMHAN